MVFCFHNICILEFKQNFLSSVIIIFCHISIKREKRLNHLNLLFTDNNYFFYITGFYSLILFFCLRFLSLFLFFTLWLHSWNSFLVASSFFYSSSLSTLYYVFCLVFQITCWHDFKLWIFFWLEHVIKRAFVSLKRTTHGHIFACKFSHHKLVYTNNSLFFEHVNDSILSVLK